MNEVHRVAEETHLGGIGEVRGVVAARQLAVVGQAETLHAGREHGGRAVPCSTRPCVDGQAGCGVHEVIDREGRGRRVAGRGRHEAAVVVAVRNLRRSADDTTVFAGTRAHEAHAIRENRNGPCCFSGQIIAQREHGVLQKLRRNPVGNGHLFGDQLHAVPTRVGIRDARVLADEVGLEASDATGHDERVRLHVHVAGVLGEHTVLLDKDDQLVENFLIDENAAEAVHAFAHRAAVDHAVICAPAGSVRVTEKLGLVEHAGAVRTLFGVGTLEATETTGTRKVVINLRHGSALLGRSGGRNGSHRSGGRLVQNSAKFEFLRCDRLVELDAVANLFSTLAEAANLLLLRLFLFDVLFRRLGLGLVLLHAGLVGGVRLDLGVLDATLFLEGAHLGEDGGEFVEELLDLGRGFHVIRFPAR